MSSRRLVVRAVAAVAVAALSVGLVTAPSYADDPTTAFLLTGDTGEVVTGGSTWTNSAADATFSVSSTTDSVTVTVDQAEPAVQWSAVFRSADGVDLAAQTYAGAEHAITGSALRPGLAVTGNGHTCALVAGTFRVLELVRDGGTGDVTGFAAIFEQRCGGASAAARGAILWNSALSLPTSTTTTLTAYPQAVPGTQVTLTGTLVDDTATPIAGGELLISRTDEDGTTYLPSVESDASGAFTVTDTIGTTTATYYAIHSGSATHLMSSARKVIAPNLPVPTATTTTLTGPGPVQPGATVGLSGTLVDVDAVGMVGAVITVTRVDAAGTTTLPAIMTGVDGAFTASNVIGSSTATYTAVYAGSPLHSPSQAVWVVDPSIPLPSTSTLTLTRAGSGAVTPGTVVDIDGLLTDPDTLPIGSAPITISRHDAAGTTTLPGTTTDASGEFTFSDTVGSSSVTYTASYAGDGTAHLATTGTTTVTVAKVASALTFTAPTSGARGRAYTLSGTLTSLGAGVVGATVSLRITDLSGSRTRTATTGPGGAFSLSDPAAVGGSVRWVASWGGDATRVAAASVARSLTLSRSRTSVSIKATKARVTYGSRTKVTMRLGTTYNGRTVRLYARPLGTFVGAPGLLVATGRVNSKGYFVATPKVNGRTTFTAYFGGDYRYEPTSRSVTVRSTSLITTGLSGYSGIDRGVRLYRNGTDPVLVIKVAPSQTGACVSITAQILVQQRYWRSAAASACTRLGPGSVAIVRFVSARTIGATYRFRASVKAGPNGSGATSGWAYARFSL